MKAPGEDLWRPIYGIPGYAMNFPGRVRKLPQTVTNGFGDEFTIPGCEIVERNGRVTLVKDGKRVSRTISELKQKTFSDVYRTGRIPEK